MQGLQTFPKFRILSDKIKKFRSNLKYGIFSSVYSFTTPEFIVFVRSFYHFVFPISGCFHYLVHLSHCWMYTHIALFYVMKLYTNLKANQHLSHYSNFGATLSSGFNYLKKKKNRF